MSAGDRPSSEWAEINDLFHRALEHPPAERDAFVRKAAGGRLPIVREVSRCFPRTNARRPSSSNLP